MCELQSLFEKKVDAMLAKMFGDQPSDLKTVTKLTLMNTVLTEDMKETLRKIRQKNLEEAEMLRQELEMTLRMPLVDPFALASLRRLLLTTLHVIFLLLPR